VTSPPPPKLFRHATRTPSGVGFARTARLPQAWDVIETGITGVGLMRNVIRAEG
jgi:hypothetical protein